ncbi:MAG: hypothetical protein ABIT71_17415 [Vicinamibacteraceae bacterium]
MLRHLWRYFAEDFFHDGELSRLRIRPVRRQVSFDLVCPNVKRFDGFGNFEFVNVPYHVVIDDVWRSDMQIDDEGETSDSVRFLAAEIETEDEAIATASTSRDDEYHSLILHTSRFWLTLVFGYIDVQPREPAATDLMLADSRYLLPFTSIDPPPNMP